MGVAAKLRDVSTRYVLISIVATIFAGQFDCPPPARGEEPSRELQRARIFLQAGDFRRARGSCEAELGSSPSPRSYVFLAYVYHAVHGYLDHLAATDQWVRVEQLYLNLAAWRLDDLVDPPDVMARIAKELIQQAVLRQAEVTVAMASRLDSASTASLWEQQRRWREAHPDDWWFSVPPEWAW